MLDVVFNSRIPLSICFRTDGVARDRAQHVVTLEHYFDLPIWNNEFRHIVEVDEIRILLSCKDRFSSTNADLNLLQ
jgi:hypothetical protein